MLILTERASNVIRSIADQPEYPDTTGLRIATAADGQGRLSAMPVENAQAGDQVIENEGARVFLDADVALRLDDQVLDILVDDQNKLEFVLADQHA